MDFISHAQVKVVYRLAGSDHCFLTCTIVMIMYSRPSSHIEFCKEQFLIGFSVFYISIYSGICQKDSDLFMFSSFLIVLVTIRF